MHPDTPDTAAWTRLLIVGQLRVQRTKDVLQVDVFGDRQQNTYDGNRLQLFSGVTTLTRAEEYFGATLAQRIHELPAYQRELYVGGEQLADVSGALGKVLRGEFWNEQGFAQHGVYGPIRADKSGRDYLTGIGVDLCLPVDDSAFPSGATYVARATLAQLSALTEHDIEFEHRLTALRGCPLHIVDPQAITADKLDVATDVARFYRARAADADDPAAARAWADAERQLLDHRKVLGKAYALMKACTEQGVTLSKTVKDGRTHYTAFKGSSPITAALEDERDVWQASAMALGILQPKASPDDVSEPVTVVIGNAIQSLAACAAHAQHIVNERDDVPALMHHVYALEDARREVKLNGALLAERAQRDSALYAVMSHAERALFEGYAGIRTPVSRLATQGVNDLRVAMSRLVYGSGADSYVLTPRKIIADDELRSLKQQYPRTAPELNILAPLYDFHGNRHEVSTSSTTQVVTTMQEHYHVWDRKTGRSLMAGYEGTRLSNAYPVRNSAPPVQRSEDSLAP
ncbi:hypothetical protein [Cupriavidus sp. TMH.W2]|uniref:hypothetical protein n=1 Tax=Cupriavidus sp. TMH.W2 TaxID=3434465 RepID=UPI003D77724E